MCAINSEAVIYLVQRNATCLDFTGVSVMSVCVSVFITITKHR